ncbi:hypothetical protein HDU98_005433 [Podochytrium sp. JEL0797]|nr:hypothetical protein HDU98_005433 [Podochytrium sp. JEL0797]
MATIDPSTIVCLIRPPTLIPSTWTLPFTSPSATISNCVSTCPHANATIFLAPTFPSSSSLSSSSLEPTSLTCYCDVSGVGRLVEMIPYFRDAIYCNLKCDDGNGVCGGLPGYFGDGSMYASAVVAYTVYFPTVVVPSSIVIPPPVLIATSTSPLILANPTTTTNPAAIFLPTLPITTTTRTTTTSTTLAILPPTTTSLTTTATATATATADVQITGWTITPTDWTVMIASIAGTIVFLAVLTYWTVLRREKRRKREEVGGGDGGEKVGGGAGVFKNATMGEEGKKKKEGRGSVMVAGDGGGVVGEGEKQQQQQVKIETFVSQEQIPGKKAGGEGGGGKAVIVSRDLNRELTVQEKHDSIRSIAAAYGMTPEQYVQWYHYQAYYQNANAVYANSQAMGSAVDTSEYLQTYDPKNHKYISTVAEGRTPVAGGIPFLEDEEEENGEAEILTPAARRRRHLNRMSLIYSVADDSSDEAAAKRKKTVSFSNAHRTKSTTITASHRKSSMLSLQPSELSPVSEATEVTETGTSASGSSVSSLGTNFAHVTGSIESRSTGASSRSSTHRGVPHATGFNKPTIQTKPAISASEAAARMAGGDESGPLPPPSTLPSHEKTFEYELDSPNCASPSLIMTELNSASQKHMSEQSFSSFGSSVNSKRVSVWSMGSESSVVAGFAKENAMLEDQVKQMIEEQRRQKKLLSDRRVIV